MKPLSSLARATSPPKQPTILDATAVDPEVATRRKREASFRAMAKQGIAKIDDLNDLIAQMDAVAPSDELRQLARDADLPLKTREQHLPRASDDKLQPTVVKKAFSPALEKLKDVFSAIAKGDSTE